MKNQDLLQKFANLPSEKRAQIMAQLQAQGFDLATPTQPTSDNGASVQTSRAIPKVDRTTPIPLSFPQERLWFLHQLEPDSTSYNSPVLLRLTGQPDVAALEASFRYLITRHESLRTTFVKENHDGEATQMIHPPSWATQFVLVPTPVESAKMAEELAQEETMTLFDLGDGPLLRVRLFQIATDEFLLFFSIHHIISDAWSLSIFMQELTHAYRAYGAGQQPTLPDLPIQYADFAAWQRQWMTTDYLKPQLEYWKAQLGGTLPTLDLPLDFPRPRQQTVSGGMHHVTLSKELSQSLRVLSQHHDATLFMTLLAAFNLLLARLSGQDDILIGTPMAGRSQAEVEGLIGLFLNTLVLRTDLSGDPTFTALLGSVKQTVLDAHKHQDVPFEKLVEELHPERDLSRAPIFQVFFNMPPQTQPAEWPHVQTEF
ncbi:MAG: condensation domain-containing protein [Chloroflexota bacterium]